MTNDYNLSTPEETAQQLAQKVRALRLSRNLKQATLAERSGVSLASLRRFERTSLISLQNLLKLSFALGRLSDFEPLLQPPAAGSIAELKDTARPQKPKRGAL